MYLQPKAFWTWALINSYFLKYGMNFEALIVKESIITNRGIQFTFRKDYGGRLRRKLGQMMSSGLIELWYEAYHRVNYYTKGFKLAVKLERRVEELSVTKVQFVYVISGFLVGIGIIVGIMEFAWIRGFYWVTMEKSCFTAWVNILKNNNNR